MRVFSTETAFRKKEDIQVQTALSRLLVVIKFDTGVNINLALQATTLRARQVSTQTGTRTQIDRTPLSTLFEIAAAKEGFFRIDEPTGTVTGFVDVSDEGALALGVDTYLSVDVENPGYNIEALTLNAMGGPRPTNKFTRYNPLSIQGTIKDIPLAGIKAIAVRPYDVDNLQLQYPGMAHDMPQAELNALGQMLNDLVSVNQAGNIVAGIANWLLLNVEDAIRAVIEPSAAAQSAGQFNIYLLSTETLS